jgi:hypothetical protein
LQIFRNVHIICESICHLSMYCICRLRAFRAEFGVSEQRSCVVFGKNLAYITARSAVVTEVFRNFHSYRSSKFAVQGLVFVVHPLCIHNSFLSSLREKLYLKIGRDRNLTYRFEFVIRRHPTIWRDVIYSELLNNPRIRTAIYGCKPPELMSYESGSNRSSVSSEDPNGEACCIKVLTNLTGCGISQLTENALQCIVDLMVFTK